VTVHFASLDTALEVFQFPVESRGRIRELAAAHEHDKVWIPNSRSYTALGHHGPVVLWVGKTYAQPANGDVIPLPGYAPGTGAGTGGAAGEPEAQICPGCFTQKPSSGLCDTCDTYQPVRRV
jgi:hypothetical protein